MHLAFQEQKSFQAQYSPFVSYSLELFHSQISFSPRREAVTVLGFTMYKITSRERAYLFWGLSLNSQDFSFQTPRVSLAHTGSHAHFWTIMWPGECHTWLSWALFLNQSLSQGVKIIISQLGLALRLEMKLSFPKAYKRKSGYH